MTEHREVSTTDMWVPSVARDTETRWSRARTLTVTACAPLALVLGLSACSAPQAVPATPEVQATASAEDRGCVQVTRTERVCETVEAAAPSITVRYDTFELLANGTVRACGCDSVGISFCQVTDAEHIEALKNTVSDPELVCKPDVNT